MKKSIQKGLLEEINKQVEYFKGIYERYQGKWKEEIKISCNIVNNKCECHPIVVEDINDAELVYFFKFYCVYKGEELDLINVIVGDDYAVCQNALDPKQQFSCESDLDAERMAALLDVMYHRCLDFQDIMKALA